jgi:site-specific recombinase XerD
VTGKGGKDRLVPLGEEAMHWLRRYLDESRPQLDKGATTARAALAPRSAQNASRNAAIADASASGNSGSRVAAMRRSAGVFALMRRA